MSRTLTDDERRAISSLKRLAKKCPQTLKLFAWSGSLTIMDADMKTGSEAELDFVMGIPCDGGDP